MSMVSEDIFEGLEKHISQADVDSLKDLWASLVNDEQEIVASFILEIPFIPELELGEWITEVKEYCMSPFGNFPANG